MVLVVKVDLQIDLSLLRHNGCNIRDVTSGGPQMACWGEFSIVIYRNMAYIQTAAASCGGEIPSCLGIDPEFHHQPFQQW